MNKGFNEKNGGITLIALVVTIVVLLILAGVSLNAVIGNSGIITRTQEASKETDIAETREQILMELMGIYAGSGDYTNDDVITAVKTVTGQEVEKNTETITTAKENEVDISDLWKKTPKVGDYVNYTSDTGTYIVASGDTGSGYTSNQSYTTGTLAWRVLSIDESTGEIELVSATAGSTLYLKGANGYNHAVDILNDLCETLYSKTVNGTKVATGRSINVEDINAKTTYDYTTYTNYGTVYTPGNKQYPNLYMAELGSTAKGLNETTELLEGSERVEKGTVNASGITEYSAYMGSSTATTLYATITYYNYAPESYLNTDLGINTAPTGLINIRTTYFLASRCVKANASVAWPSLRTMNENGQVNYSNMYNSSGASLGGVWAVRPVVSLASSVKLTIDEANTTEDVTYWNIEF